MSNLGVTRYFTPDEANQMLPQAREHLDVISDHVRRARALKAGLDKGDSDAEAAEELVKSRLAKLESDIDTLLKELKSKGVHVKGVAPALLDFPALRNGQEVFLCWREGEDEVQYWHPLHTGYKGRRTVGDDDPGIWEWVN